MASDIDRALSKITAEAARAASDLASLRSRAEVLPLPIRRQLNTAIEELDLLRHVLHEATLSMAIHGSPVIADAASGRAKHRSRA